ncbi:Alpha-D-glucose-1-phosphate phosphatase YihX [Marinomonas spartinae]|uniref:Alpha-D-glucose-1-phosphate phosphatase YihX n=1 Tax=Marinomonas spartinae TaxID=1792290 RepID=A0A1A8TGV2_9GAMM|nr:HAD family phosphatase [Marinomonas spartinae]SBS31258.1 Alpha-D-glucose-1-phosphate phosphatase YihX [Marinomonas spartinae]SBS32415.1 Alpha-D-glucose-1-phosphate phosphatase YihX [Marinomonas spartinae]
MLVKNQDINVVMFDLGNVLVDLGSIEQMYTMLNTQGDITEVWLKWLKSPAVAAFDSGEISFDEFAERLPTEVGTEMDKEAFKACFKAWPKQLFDGALALVDSVKPHYHRAILSNTNAAHWPRLMNEMGLAGHFHSYFASHLIGKVKPEPSLYQHVLNALQVPPESIIFVDDNQINVDAANALGIQAHLARGVEEAKSILSFYNVLLKQ